MTDDAWRRDLMQRHGDLFRQYGDPTVGDGWRALVEKAIERIAAVVASAPGAKVTITQIKEKFGGLRIYFDPKGLPNEKLAQVREAIELAEARADCTCEACGAEGRLYLDDGCYLTRCERHAHGEPVPRPHNSGLFVKVATVDGAVRIVSARRYDREHDVFINVPPEEAED
jgi:hypothetical protein